MRLDELEEAEVKKVVFTFGRLNPPHFGHHALIQTLQKAAQKQNCDWFLFVSSKTGDEKNPLTYEQKVWWIQALFPETKGHLIIDQKIKTPLVAATWLYNQGYRAATFVAGEDDMSSYGEMIKSGNAHGQANPNALKSGKGFIFNPLDFAISPRLASATNARRNVADGDPEAFVRSILGPKINPQLAELVQNQLYPTLRKAMGLSESIKESWNVFPTVREIAQKHMSTPDEVHRQINRGVKVEFEKNQDIETATDIAMANLTKNFEHYKSMAKIEDVNSKKKLGEVADQPYRFINPVSTATTQKSMFQTDSGSTIQVFIQVDTGNGVADIGFFDATDKENPTIGVTGKGDAFRVFATVGSIVKQFVAKRKPPYISFSGKSSDAGRIKLYDMIAKNIGRYLPEYKLIDSGFANGDKGYTFKRIAQESVSEVAKVKLSSDPNNFGAWVNDSGKPEQTIMIPINKLSGFEPDSKFDDPLHAKNLVKIVKAIKAGKELPPILVRRHGVDRFQVLDGHHRFKAYRMAGIKSIPARLVDPKNVSEESDRIAPAYAKMRPFQIVGGYGFETQIHKFEAPSHSDAERYAEKWAAANIDLIPGKAKRYFVRPITKFVQQPSSWTTLGDSIEEEKKPKKPKTIIDGALKTLIAKGRSEDEAIADLKKEIDGKFYDLTETREGALNWLKSYLPTWPEYVLRDWLYRNLTSKEHDPSEHPKAVVDRSLAGEGMSAQTQWKLIPNFEFKIEKLHPDTQRRINIRAGGSANPMKVPKDAERHATQAALAQQQGGVRKEPVIGKMTPQGFELIEGWHRTIQHFKQFPDGYTGPAWIAMNAVSENITEDESAKPLVFLDMDGVLADFFGDWSKISGVSHYKDIGNVEQALQLVRDHPTFWIDLPLLPNARALVKTVIEKYGEYRICSTPLAGDGRSKPGKIAWINKHFADMPPAEVVLTHNKAERAQHNGVASILVDDFGSNIDKWKAAGGIGIKYEDSAFPKVATILTSIAKSGVPK
jgi:5'(3')-deoxyribonucleotidase